MPQRRASPMHAALPKERGPINPETGAPWRLTDPEVAAELQADIEAMRRDPALAARFLREVGIINAKGGLTKRYGG